MSHWAGRDGAGWSEKLGLPVEVHASLPSTNDRARERLREGAEAPFLILADRQTRGRGRSGAPWDSPPGIGIWMSVGLAAVDPWVDRLLPLRVGLGLIRTLGRTVSGHLLLKWPNDLYLAPPKGGKVAGILCEVVAGSAGFSGVVVGIGLNLTGTGRRAPEHAAALASRGEHSREEILPRMVEAVLGARDVSFPELTAHEQESWRARDLLMGRRVAWVRAEGSPLPGRARGVDALGRLVLDTEAGPVLVENGSIRLLEQTTSGAQ